MSNRNDSDFEITDKLNMVKKQSTYEIIIEQLQDLIMSGTLKPGQKLPGERVLSEKFGSSRNSVRLALKLLEFMNLLEVRPGSGVYISSSKNLSDASINLNWKNIAKHHPLMDLIETRKCFEPFVAALAAENATESEIEEMEENLEIMENGIKINKEVITQAARFHELIYKSSKNIILNQIGHMLHNLSDESKKISLRKYEHTIQSLEEHKKIIFSIKERDPNLASESMRDHLLSVEEHLKNTVK